MRRLLAHLVGDFVLQSDWMAAAKVHGHGRERTLAAVTHAVTYTACFVPFTRNPLRSRVFRRRTAASKELHEAVNDAAE